MTDLYGRRIRELREKRGWDQKTLAAAVGIDQSYLSKIESGQRGLGLDLARRIAGALSVSVSALVGEPEEEAPGREPDRGRERGPEGATRAGRAFEEVVRLVAARHPDAVLHLRTIAANRDRLTPRDEQFLATLIAAALDRTAENLEIRETENREIRETENLKIREAENLKIRKVEEEI